MITKNSQASDLIKSYVISVWRQNEGPFENLFRLFTYITPVWGFGWLPLILDKIGSVILGISLEDFGKWADLQLGLGPGSNIEKIHILQLEGLLENLASGQIKTTSFDNKIIIVKNAISFGLTGRIIKHTVQTIWKIILSLLLMLGLSKVGDVYKMLEKKKIPDSNNLFGPQSMQSLTKLLAPLQYGKKTEVEQLTKQLEEKYKL